MKYDILLFDADDTLFDFYHTGQTSFLKACKTVGLNATEKDYDVYSAINQKRWDLYSLGKITKEEVLLGRFEEYARVKKIDLDVRKFYELYEQNLSETAILYPETEKMLTLLKKAGARIFLITNGIKKVQRGRLALSGIRDFFEGIFISDEIGFKKPSAEYFDYVSSRIENLIRPKLSSSGTLSFQISRSESTTISTPAGLTKIIYQIRKILNQNI